MSNSSDGSVVAPDEMVDSNATVADATRDIAEVPAVEVITTAAVHLMSAAAVKVGLAEFGVIRPAARAVDGVVPRFVAVDVIGGVILVGFADEGGLV